MSNPYGINFESRAFNANDEEVIERATVYLQAFTAPKMADLKDDQQLDLNDNEFRDSTPGVEEFINAFSPYFPQVVALRSIVEPQFADAREWGHLETLTQLLPALSFGIKNGLIELTDTPLIEFGKMVYRKGRQVATGTLELRDENKEAGQS